LRAPEKISFLTFALCGECVMTSASQNKVTSLYSGLFSRANNCAFTGALLEFVLVGAALVLTACGGGSAALTTPPIATVDPGKFVATAVQGSAPASVCPNGGITVEGGIDSNGNKLLDASEVTSTQYVCNGAPGAAGTNAPPNTLVAVTIEPLSAICPAGGSRINVGRDTNNNGILDVAEIISFQSVCNGAPATNAPMSMISIVFEPPGSFCPLGGNRVNNGIDANRNGSLDLAEIISFTFICKTPPGMTWVNTTAAAVQALPNTGYLANNNAGPVTITLPDAPAVGDIVQVTGVGSGGWKMAQNAGQSVITMNLPGTSDGRNWKPQAFAANCGGDCIVCRWPQTGGRTTGRPTLHIG
jgi:hypothetical protein